MSIKPGREVSVAGVGLHPFGRFPEKTVQELARTAVLEALEDAGVGYQQIQAAYFGHVYFQGMSLGETVLRELGLTGIPIINIENACSSSSTAFEMAFWAVASGIYDIALTFGAEKVPRGPVSVTATDSPQRLMGTDHMMASYALRARRYMEEFGAPVEAFAHVAEKAHRNAVHNPYAHFQKVFTIEEILNSRMIADPLTLYQCCPTSDGASAIVICANEAVSRYKINPNRLVKIAGVALQTSDYNDRNGEHLIALRTAKESYEMAGVGPEDVSVVQVHDAATNAGIFQLEGLGLVERGKGWQLELEGGTEINGKVPVNTDGGLQAMGHPLGATGTRMLHELVTQLRGEAGVRQVSNPRIGIAENSGAGEVCTVIILEK
ncbi:MAG TPA: thiolase family protein [Dehalococcoidia bacterium]|nr:thiolase family protein [Dehalococcoidia bacterium]